MTSNEATNPTPDDDLSAPTALLQVLNKLGICRIDLTSNLSINREPQVLANHLYNEGQIYECNDRFCKYIAGSPSEDVEGARLSQYLNPDFKELLTAFFENECQLIGRKYQIDSNECRERYFEINLSGRVTENKLGSVWASFQEVTERRNLEDRLVSALEQQRTKLARQLHDSIGQLLTSVRILSDDLANKLPSEMASEKRLAEQIFEFATEATEEASHLKDGLLAPEELTEEGLIEALERLTQATNSLPNITCSFTTDLETQFEDTRTALQLYRIAQEAVNNAVRHGNPDEIDIVLTESSGDVTLEIRDDGSGFETNAPDMEGLGLDSMQYRADLIGFDLNIRSSLGQGTTVECALRSIRN